MKSEATTPLEILASVTDTVESEWEALAGPDSGVGVDFWYRHAPSGKKAYLNLDQDHLTVSVGGEKLYDGHVAVSEA